MSDSTPQEVFTRQLNDVIDKYGADRRRHKLIALILKVSTSALGAVATILLGWQNPGDAADAMKNGALVLTSLVTLFAAYDAFFEPRKLWVRETSALNSMKDLRRRWEIAVATGQGGADGVKEYSDAFQAILARSLKEWVDGKQTGS